MMIGRHVLTPPPFPLPAGGEGVACRRHDGGGVYPGF